jgi:pimeloyl-ACP methyl ester carboxylesterase
MARTNQGVAGAGRVVARVAGRAATSPTTRRTAPVALAGAALLASVAIEHRTVRRMRALPELASPRVGPVEGQATTVIASDGVPLHVVESGDPDAKLTLVFVHGFCVTADSWVFQQRGLADLGRMVFYDQRAHGRSGASDVAHCTVDQLGDDLSRVLSERVPTGPIVLVGHSMGGMTVLALAAAHPELFSDRVVAVALLSTSAGDLARVTFGLPAAVSGVAKRVLPGLAVGVRRTSPLLERARRRGSDLSWLMTRRIGFGATDVPPSVVSFLETMIADTPVPVIMAFLPTLLDHDKLAAASVLRTVPTLVLTGDADLMTPLEHSRTLAAELPEAELVVEQGAGHTVVLERPDAVNERIRALVARAAGGHDVPYPRASADDADPPSRGRGGRLRSRHRRPQGLRRGR